MAISNKFKTVAVDLAERAGATFAQAFVAAITVGSITDAHALKLAGVAGAYAVAKFLIVKANAFLKTAPTTPTA